MVLVKMLVSLTVIFIVFVFVVNLLFLGVSVVQFHVAGANDENHRHWS